MCRPIRKHREATTSPEFSDPVPERPYTAWDDPMGDYNPYSIYEHPYNMQPESLKLYLYDGRTPDRGMLLEFVERLKNI